MDGTCDDARRDRGHRLHFTDFVQFGYSPAVVTMVDLLTHDKHRHTYRQYVQHIKNSGKVGAIKIKLSDNVDNSVPSRHIALNPIISQGMLKRYTIGPPDIVGLTQGVWHNAAHNLWGQHGPN